MRFLTLLRRTGMSIQGMLRFVELTRAGDHTIADRVEVLSAHRDRLVAELAQLAQHLDAIDLKIDYYRGVLTSEPLSSEPLSSGVAAESST